MADDFSSWRRLQERPQVKEPFVSKARHIHRFNKPHGQNQAKQEAERDRVIFLWIMAAVVAVGVVTAVAMFLMNKQAGAESDGGGLLLNQDGKAE